MRRPPNGSVVFFTPRDQGQPQKIVGWYHDAKVYRNVASYPPQDKNRIQQHLDAQVKRRRQQGLDIGAIAETQLDHYRLEAKSSNAVLLPIPMRKLAPLIPWGSDATGQSNVCYAYKRGARKTAPWIQDAIKFVTDYSGPNLLATEAEAEAEAFAVQERAAGFQSDRKIRDVVEEYAMQKAEEELGNRGFGNFDNTSKRRCYDYTCEKDGALYYVEVKGTQGSGASVILTKNEVEHWEQHKQSSIAVIVHDVKVDRNGESLQASAGTLRVCLPWDIQSEELETVQYKWTLPESPKISI